MKIEYKVEGPSPAHFVAIAKYVDGTHEHSWQFPIAGGQKRSVTAAKDLRKILMDIIKK